MGKLDTGKSPATAEPVYAVETYSTFRVRYFTVIHLELLLQLGVVLCPINASIEVELDPIRWARAAAASSSVRRLSHT